MLSSRLGGKNCEENQAAKGGVRREKAGKRKVWWKGLLAKARSAGHDLFREKRGQRRSRRGNWGKKKSQEEKVTKKIDKKRKERG